jgi:ribonuclease T2
MTLLGVNMKKKLSILSLLLLMAVTLAAFQLSDLYRFKSKTTQHISTDNLLAISWQNAFCQTHQNRRECRNVKPSHFSASHFTLHGLWPQPRSKVNCRGPHKVYLPKQLYHELLEVMPAARSGLHKHEWKKHGTCYGTSPERYFRDAIYLVKEINNSPVRDLFARNIGKTVTIEQVRYAFDKAFGKGSGRKVKMVCNRGLITELWINLRGEIKEGVDLAKLLKKAPMAKGSCQKGKVDAAGF